MGRVVVKGKILRRVAVVFAAAVLIVAAIAALGVVRQSAREKEIDALVANLSDEKERETAERQLAAVTDSTGLRRIVWHLGDENPAVRDIIANIIGRIGAPAVEPLADATRRAYVSQRAWATANPTLQWVYRRWPKMVPGNDYELWWWRAEEWLPAAYGKVGAPARGALIEMLSDTYMRSESHTLLWLARIGDPRDLDVFIAYLGNQAIWMAPAYAAVGLGNIKAARDGRRKSDLPGDNPAWREFDRRSGEVVLALIKNLDDPDEDPDQDTRNSAAFALAEYRDSPTAVAAVLDVIKDTEESAWARTVAAAGLQYAEYPDASETLLGVLGDSDWRVLDAAMRALLYDRGSGRSRAGEKDFLVFVEVCKSLDYGGRRNVENALLWIRGGAYTNFWGDWETLETRKGLQQAAQEALRQIQAGETQNSGAGQQASPP